MSKRWKKILLIAGFCIPLLALVVVQVKAGNILSNYNWSDINTQHENRMMQEEFALACLLADCSENKWYLGQNIKFNNQTQESEVYTPNLKEIIRGVDLGISVQMPEGHTMMYMGDTNGNVSSTNCGVTNQCNDAITMIDSDHDPRDGVDTKILVDFDDLSKYWPLIIPGVNVVGGSLPEDDFAPFNVPTGATTGYTIWDSINDPHYTVYLWYTTAMTTNDAQSFLTCSNDGVWFHPCPVPDWYPVDPYPVVYFSSDKFIHVSPVQFSHTWWNKIDSNGSCALCKLKSHLTNYSFGYSPGMLLFGAAGGPRNRIWQDGGYRESPLYLAYMELQSLHTWYYTGDDWSRDEADAEPIISPVGHPRKKRFQFGELSVQLVQGSDFDDSYLVMLSNHDLRRVYYRTALLSEPENWSLPQMTCAVGYGPYIMDTFTDVKQGNPDRLVMYHTISAWNGNQAPAIQEPYGVFTTQLRLMQRIALRNRDVYYCGGQAPVWPPQP